MWAEAFGLGELGLMPDQFWSLTVHEFWLKFEGFARADDRMRALVFELAAMTGRFDLKEQKKVHRAINQLRRYPIKQWLRPE